MGKRNRILFLAGMAIGWLAATGAEAKDRLPPAKAPQTSGCEFMGPGFVKIEGTDTCMKISGSMRLDFGASTAPRADVFSASGH